MQTSQARRTINPLSQESLQKCLNMRRHQVHGAVRFPLLDFSWDLILYTARFLPTESQVALMLTSKKVYMETGPRPLAELHDDHLAKGRFLRLLEKDLPHMLHCACCNALYDWRKAKAESRYGLYNCPKCVVNMCRSACKDGLYRRTSMPRDCNCEGSLLTDGHEGDLLLLRHLHGPQYGLPLSLLEHECTVPFLRGGSVIARKYCGKIIGNEILMHTTISFELNTHANPLREVSKLGPFLCPPSREHGAAVALCAWLHEDGDDRKSSSMGTKRKCRQLMKCTYCETDFRINVQKTRDKVILNLDLYENLGGRTPLTLAQIRRSERGQRFNDLLPMAILGDRIKEAEARNLEETFMMGSRMPSPSPSPSRSQELKGLLSRYDCIAPNWKCAVGHRRQSTIELPDFGYLPPSLAAAEKIGWKHRPRQYDEFWPLRPDMSKPQLNCPFLRLSDLANYKGGPSEGSKATAPTLMPTTSTVALIRDLEQDLQADSSASRFT